MNNRTAEGAEVRGGKPGRFATKKKRKSTAMAPRLQEMEEAIA